MSENKRYYWYKMKSDFFDEIIIKFLRKKKNGDKMILLFQQIMLLSLKTDGYLYHKKMFSALEEQISLAIGAKPSIIKELLDILIDFGAIEKVDESTYYIKMLEDCVGSETGDARRKRQSKQSNEGGKFPENVGNFPPEIEKETDIEKELYLEKKRTPSSFSGKKKGGRYGTQNNYFNNDGKRFNKYAGVEKIINSQELVYVSNEEREKYKPDTGPLSKPIL